jgi:hypothetical protein
MRLFIACLAPMSFMSSSHLRKWPVLLILAILRRLFCALSWPLATLGIGLKHAVGRILNASHPESVVMLKDLIQSGILGYLRVIFLGSRMAPAVIHMLQMRQSACVFCQYGQIKTPASCHAFSGISE